jgi:hypothetical protein
VSTEIDEFEAARQQLDKVINALMSQEGQRQAHGEVEALISREGNEILRCLLQGYMDQRARSEIHPSAIKGCDGLMRKHSRERRRTLMSLFGEVTIQRWGYSGRGLTSEFPLDSSLNLPADKYSHGLRRKIGLEVAKGAFEEAVKAVIEGTGGKVAKRQAEQISQAMSVDFDAYYTRRPTGMSQGLLVMSTDGKGIVVRKEDLREATRKAAEGKTQKLKTRLGRGEKRNRKRMSTVAAVYDIAPNVRTPESIMGNDEAPLQRPKPQHKRVWASLRSPPSDVIEAVFAEAERRDPMHARPWLILVDGQEAQLREVNAAIARHRGYGVVIQDFVHVLEYLWKAAYCFHEEGSAQAEQWVLKRAKDLLRSKTSDVAAGMRRSATRQALSQTARRPVDKCADYLLKNKERLDYATALAQGWPIATGIIEGACRHLVKDRMDLTGARWSLEGAEAVLQLRSLRASGDFEDYLAFHWAQEHQRHYATPSPSVTKMAA